MSRFSLIAIVVLFAWPASVGAQDARAAYRQGVEAAREGRWEDAERAFVTAYDATGRVELLLNLAAVRAEGGQLRAAVETYRRFFGEAEPAVREQHGPAAREAMNQLEARLARLHVEVRNRGGDDVLRIDEVPVTQMPEEGVELDPGPHHVALQRADEEVAMELVQLAEGERRRIVLEAPALVDEPIESGGDDDALILGLVIGGSALVVATVVTIILVVTLGGDGEIPQGYSGNVRPGRIEASLIRF